MSKDLPGDHSVMVPPDPIPNSEVKRDHADDSAVYLCKSRSLPGTQLKTPMLLSVGVFLFSKYLN